jgi:hypothetical protein
MHRASVIVAALTASVLSACVSQPLSSTPPSTPYPPEACGAAFPADAPRLKLARTRAPEAEDTALPPPQSLSVNRSLSSAGRWFDRADGWSTLALRLHSDNAASLSLYLSDMEIPRDAQVWACSPDGRQRHGPYRHATGGQLWTPAVSGDTLNLQVWVPSFRRGELRGRIVDAQATP